MNKTGRFEKGQTPWNKDKPFLAGKNNPMYGKHHTEETIRKIIETKRLRKDTYNNNITTKSNVAQPPVSDVLKN